MSNHRAYACTTGTGSSAVSLPKNSSAVIATDASKNQINDAKKFGICYQIANAEYSRLELENK